MCLSGCDASGLCRPISLFELFFFAPKINSCKFSTPTLFLNYFSRPMCALCVRACVCMRRACMHVRVCVHVSLCACVCCVMFACACACHISVCVYGNVGQLPSVSLACSVVAPCGLDCLS